MHKTSELAEVLVAAGVIAAGSHNDGAAFSSERDLWHARAYQDLQKDPAIDAFITNMFLGVEGCDMAKYWLDFLAMVWCQLHTD